MTNGAHASDFRHFRRRAGTLIIKASSIIFAWLLTRLVREEQKMASVVTRKGEVVQDPPFVQKFLSDPRAGWLFLPLRIWLGYQWVSASLHKIGNPDWVVTGNALKGFWAGAVAIPANGHPAITFDWYRAFLQFLLNTQAYTWFAKLVAYGELLIGIGLILGAF